MKVPEGFAAKVTALAAAKNDHQARRELIEKERVERRVAAQGRPKDPEAEEHAQAVYAWCFHFLKSVEAQTFFRLVGAGQPLTLFSSRFWLREPSPDIEVEARFMLLANGQCRYEERRGNMIGDTASSWITPTFLSCEFNPVYLRQMRKQLESASPDRFMNEEIDRIIADYR
jgi:hypothetical protein